VSTATTTHPDWSASRWRLLIALGLASGITSLPNVAIVLAIPTLHHELDASTTELQWTVTGYLLAYSALMIGAGRLADQFGRVRLLYIGTALFMAASVLGALADTALLLIVAMILVGVGAAILTPGSLAIVTDRFRGSQRGIAVGIWGGATALFSGIGPAVGGVLTSELSWRWILWVNVIVGAAVLLGTRGTPESRDEEAGRDVDIAGIVTSVGGLALLILALNEAPTVWPWGSVNTIGALTLGAVLLVAFVLVERRVHQPLIDLGMFARRNVSGASIVVLVLNFAFGAALFFLPLYLEEIRNFSPIKAGLLLLPASVTMVVAMPLGGRLHDKIGPLIPIVGGMTLEAIAMLLLSRIGPGTDYGDLWWPLAMLGLGVGFALTPMNLCALGAVHQRHHGAVGALLSTLAGLGAMFGVALSGAVNESIQVDDIIDRARNAGITVSRSTASTLDGLLAGAPSATKAIAAYPPSQQATLKGIVTDSFLSALDATMVLSFGVTVVGIALTLLLIRRRDAVSEEPPAPNVARPIPAMAQRP
jgi:EmrB/QacA subfamily drug resistance transporter